MTLKPVARWILVSRVCGVSLAAMVTVVAEPPWLVRISNWSPARTEVDAVSSWESVVLMVPFGRPSRSSTLAPVALTAIALGAA